MKDEDEGCTACPECGSPCPLGTRFYISERASALEAALKVLQEPVYDDPTWLRNEVRRQRTVIKALYEQVHELRVALGDNGARGFACPHCEKAMTFCEKHGPYRRTDENQCPACRRGE